MVTLQVIGNCETNVAKMTEHEWSLIKQARYHAEESADLRKSVTVGESFNGNNENWVTASKAVHDYIHAYLHPELKVNVSYD